MPLPQGARGTPGTKKSGTHPGRGKPLRLSNTTRRLTGFPCPRACLGFGSQGALPSVATLGRGIQPLRGKKSSTIQRDEASCLLLLPRRGCTSQPRVAEGAPWELHPCPRACPCPCPIFCFPACPVFRLSRACVPDRLLRFPSSPLPVQYPPCSAGKRWYSPGPNLTGRIDDDDTFLAVPRGAGSVRRLARRARGRLRDHPDDRLAAGRNRDAPRVPGGG